MVVLSALLGFCGEFTGDRWIPLTKVINADFDISLMWVRKTC